MNIITAMNMGGDDFIAKPFDLTVLMAKLQAILRRTYDFGTIEAPLSHNGAVLNSDDATVIYNGEKIDLTKNEYRILQLLMEKKGSIVSRELLMEKLWEKRYLLCLFLKFLQVLSHCLEKVQFLL